MLLEGLLFILVTITAVYIILYFVNIYKTPFQGKQGYYELSKPPQLVLPTDSFQWTASPCTLRFAIFVENAPKTVAKVDCIDTASSSDVVSFAPTCADYSYAPCKCVGSDCTNCSLDSSSKGYLSKLLSVGDYVQLWASGYTSQNDKPYIPALLKIRTGSDGSQHYMESISLPAIPLQKWTIITIVKEGRRFDVYFGAVLQTSKLTMYMPVTPDSTLQWFAGNPMWKGKIGLFMGFNKAFFAPDVKADLETLVNTRGIPYYTASTSPLSIFSTTAPSCMFGTCSLPEVKPRNQFSVYQTNVA